MRLRDCWRGWDGCELDDGSVDQVGGRGMRVATAERGHLRRRVPKESRDAPSLLLEQLLYILTAVNTHAIGKQSVLHESPKGSGGQFAVSHPFPSCLDSWATMDPERITKLGGCNKTKPLPPLQ